MQPRSRFVPLLLATLLLLVVAARPPARTAQPVRAQVTVDAGAPGATIPRTLFGIFFEDINFAADGGLYPERVKNRSFELPDPLMGWKKAEARGGSFEIRTDRAISANNTRYLRLTTDGETAFGVMNDGYRGVGAREGETFHVSLAARRVSGTPRALRVELRTPGGRSIGETRFDVPDASAGWTTLSGRLTSSAREMHGRVAVLLEGPGTVDIDVVSVFPVDTWRGRPHGLRRDLVELLAALQPGFLRFPGGCIVEGRYLDGRYRWKETLGDPAERRPLVNRWNDEFMHRPAPDYYQSFGLGFFEYFQLAEDLGAEPLPIINCGMACQFNSGELAPIEELDEYIQDALDLIEFANGPADSPWGARRAAMGHPAPFRLKFIGIGNEQWGPEYIERFERFARALKAKHPEIRLVASAGPGPDGERFDYLWTKLRELQADLVDEHYYQPPSWFLAHASRYDAYPRTGPKVFAGEYAAHVRGRSGPERSTWEAALAEAAFITGLERNADVVELSSYAPLLGHVDAWQWSPNLIWFDNLSSVGTTSYQVQKLFATNRGERILPVRINGSPGRDGALYASAAQTEERGAIVKLVNTAGAVQPVSIAGLGSGTMRVITLAAPLEAVNTLQNPNTVVPVERTIEARGDTLDIDLPAHSVVVIRPS